MEEIKCIQIGQLDCKGFNEMTGRVYSVDGLSPSIRTFSGGNTEVKILDEPIVYDGFNQTIRADREGLKVVESIAFDEQNGYLRKDGIVGTLTTNGSSPKHNNRVVELIEIGDCRVRKLTENECFRLMGVKDSDFEKVRKNQSKSSCYHLAGDSIVTTCLMAIFGEMFGVDWKPKVESVVEELCKDGKSVCEVQEKG